MNRWSVAITTAPRNPSMLATTCESLEAAGWRNYIICRDNERQGPYQNFLRALWIAWRRLEVFGFRSPDLPLESVTPAYCMVVQDDIQITKELREYLESNDWPGNSSNCVISLFSPAALGQLNNEWNNLPWPRRTDGSRWPTSCGAQALIFPWWLATRFLHNPPAIDASAQTDFRVAKWCHDNTIPYYVPSPSFVKHTGYQSSSLKHPNANPRWRQCREWLPRVGGSTKVVV